MLLGATADARDFLYLHSDLQAVEERHLTSSKVRKHAASCRVQCNAVLHLFAVFFCCACQAYASADVNWYDLIKKVSGCNIALHLYCPKQQPWWTLGISKFCQVTISMYSKLDCGVEMHAVDPCSPWTCKQDRSVARRAAISTT